MRRMPCKVEVDRELQEVILDLDAVARRQIGDFLLGLQEDPLPEKRLALARKTNVPAFFVQLSCGFHVSWEVAGDLLPLALAGKTRGLLVRILGVDRYEPS